MIIQSKKTGKIYQLLNDNCVCKFNGEYFNCVCYRSIEKEDFDFLWNIMDDERYEKNFIKIEDADEYETYPAYLDMLNVLKRVVKEYPGKTIDNIIVQLEARLKEISK